MDKKIRLFFILLAVVHLFLVYANTNIFPAVIFPRFKYRGDDKPYTRISLYYHCGNKKTAFSLPEIVKPYDKRYVLFLNRFLDRDGYRREAGGFVLERSKTRFPCTDSVSVLRETCFFPDPGRDSCLPKPINDVYR